jgi:hypothetical protein
MRFDARSVGAVAAAGMWIGLSEFVRNQVLVASVWQRHYKALGLVFPSSPVNAALWMVWSFAFAGVLWVISRRFSLVSTIALGWVVGFVLMWLVIWNLAVLPLGTLPFAVPLSVVEVAVASWIALKIDPPARASSRPLE